MPTRAREYVVIVSRLFRSHIAGWIFGVIGLLSLAGTVYLARIGADPKMITKYLYWSAGVSFAAVGWVFLKAQYDAWGIERSKYEDESARNLRPELRGRVNNISVSGGDAGFVVRFYGELCNVRQQATTARVLVDFSTKSGQRYRRDAPAFQSTNAPGGETRFDRVRLECGIPQSFNRAALVCPDIPPQDLDVKSLRFMAEDSFGGITQIGQDGLIVDLSGASVGDGG